MNADIEGFARQEFEGVGDGLGAELDLHGGVIPLIADRHAAKERRLAMTFIRDRGERRGRSGGRGLRRSWRCRG